MQDLFRTYKESSDSKTALVKFYNHITYTVLKTGQDPIQLQFCIGDILELPEESEGIVYAKIKLIFQHQANNRQYYAFFLFDWFQATKTLDPILECPLYNIQRPEETRWLRIFPINYVNYTPQVHFIRACTSAHTITRTVERIATF